MSTRTKEEEAFLADLDREIGWQWRWETKWRRWMLSHFWASWIVRLMLLALTTFELSRFGKGPPMLWLSFTLTLLAVVNVALPQLASTFKFQQRQEVYDRHARHYSAIRVQFLSGQMDLPTAVANFTKVQSEATESIIRKTP